LSVLSRLPTLQRTAISVVAMLLLGVGGGLVWLWLASPAEWDVGENGITMGESAARGQFGVVVAFVIVGAVTSFVWATVSTLFLRDLGWLFTPVVIVVSLAAAVIAWRIGVQLGPEDPATVTGAAVGDKLPSKLAVDGLTPFLVWPIFALTGLLFTTWWGTEDADERAEPTTA